MTTAHYSKRCGCRDDNGKQLGTKCPRLSRTGHGTWSVYLTVPGDGAEASARRRKGGFSTRGEAEAYARPFVQAALEGRRVAPVAHTLATYLPVFLERRGTGRKPLSPATLGTYRVYADVIAAHSVGKVRLDELRRRHLQDFLDDMAREKGAATVDKIHTVLRAVLRAAYREELTTGNHATDLHVPQVETREKALLTVDQAHVLFSALQACSPMLHNMAELALHTGMRVGELAGLRWADVDGDVLTVSQTVVSVRGHLSIGTGKTAAARRQVALGPVALGALARQRTHQARVRLRSPIWEDNGLVFSQEDGSPVDPKYVTRRMIVVEKREKLPLMGMHGWRHIHVTLLDQAGCPLPVIQQRVGHSATNITEGVYTHRQVDAQRPWALAAEALADPNSTQPADLSTQRAVGL